MRKTIIVLQREWLELRLQRTLLLTTFLAPPIATVLALVGFFAAGLFPGSATTNLPPSASLDPTLAKMSTVELGQTIIGRQFSIMFMLLPVFIPSVIASYAIVGEKRERTLEPVLAAPIRTWELLVGKSLGALAPTLAMSAISAVVFAVGVFVLARSPAVATAVISPGWIAVLLLDAPLIALVGVGLIVIVSSRVNDPRTAQQVSAVLVVPILLLVFGNITGALLLSPLVAVVGAVILAAIALVTFRIATRLFDREAILIRWR